MGAQELELLAATGARDKAFVATKGQAHLDVEYSFARARGLCLQSADSPQLLPVLGGLLSFHVVRSELKAACDVVEQLFEIVDVEFDINMTDNDFCWIDATIDQNPCSF